MDEILRQWGRNIENARRCHKPDGTPKLNAEDGEPCMTQEDLGNRLDPPVRQATVSRWETGEREPKTRYKRQLASVLHRDVTMLFPLTRAAA